MIFSITLLAGLAVCFLGAFLCSLYRQYRPRKRKMELPLELVSNLGLIKTEDGLGVQRIFDSSKYAAEDYAFDEKHNHPVFE